MARDEFLLQVKKFAWLVLGRLALLLALIYLILFIVRVAYVLESPVEVIYGEGQVLNQANVLLSGGKLYGPIDNYPYLVSPYTPLYYYLLAGLAWLFGNSLLPGRLLSVAASLAVGGLAGLSVWEITRNRLASLSALLVYFAFQNVWAWTPLNKGDMLALALAMGGIYVTLRGRSPTTLGDLRLTVPDVPEFNSGTSGTAEISIFSLRSPRALRLKALATASAIGLLPIKAVPLFLLSFMAKQTYVAAPLAAALFLSRSSKTADGERQKSDAIRRALVFSGLVMATSLLILVPLNHATGGSFWLHAVVQNGYPWRAPAALDFAWRYAGLYPVVISSLFVAAWLYRGQRGVRSPFELRTRGAPLIIIYGALASWGFVATGRLHGADNYLLEFSAASSVTVGLVLARLLPRSGEPSMGGFLAGVFFVGLLSLQYLVGLPTQLAWLVGNRHFDDQTEFRKVSEILRASGDGILSDDLSILALGRRAVAIDSIAFSVLARRGIWDESRFLVDVQDGKFGTLILRQGLEGPNPSPVGWPEETWWTARQWDMLKSRFELVDRTEHYSIYKYRIPSAVTRAD
jgi:hypothetical protein